jgi:hypothetical protein
MIESMNGGSFLIFTSDAAYTSMDKLFNNSQQWDFSSRWDTPRAPKKEGIYRVKTTLI